jgi:predicted ATPase
MAILIKATEEKKITISGTGIELPDVYGRIRFLGDFSGTSIEGEVATFANKVTFLENKMLYTDVPIGNYKSNLEAGEVQSLETAHKYAKLAYEQMGYEVIIDITF